MTEKLPADTPRRLLRCLEGAGSRHVSPAQACEMLKLESPWDDDEDEDVPQRPEEDEDGQDDDEDDEEPLRVKKKSREGRLFL
jgi:hypothetical protein